MGMILDAFMSRCSAMLADAIHEEVILLLGVKDELQNLLRRMRSVQSLLQDAEKRRFDDSDSCTELWLSQLRDVMYDADDIIDLCRIEGSKLLADQNTKSKTSLVFCNFSSPFSCFTSIPLRHEIGNRIKELSDRLDQIYKDRRQFKLDKSTKSETPRITLGDSRQTFSMVDPLAVGTEVDAAANKLVLRLVKEKVEEKCRLFAVTGMGGIGKTTLAQKIFNHESIKNNFNLKVWVCISQTYSEIGLLQQIIQGVEGSSGNANTLSNFKEGLMLRLRDSVASGGSLFLVLDDVWTKNVWTNLLRVPLYNSNTVVRVLVTTRDDNVAKGMGAAPPIHHVEQLSRESCWDMLRRSVFPNGDEEQANELKSLGFEIVEKCGRLPLAIKVITSVLQKETTKKAWYNILSNKAWSIGKLPEELRGALYLSFEDLPSHLNHCFLYFSLYPEDFIFSRKDFRQIWVAEGFITEQENNLILEDYAEKYFDEFVERNLLQPWDLAGVINGYKMHDLIRSLALFLSKEESSYTNENVKDVATSTMLRRLSVTESISAEQFFPSIANQRGLKTLFAARSDLLLDHEKLMKLSCLRLLDLGGTKIEILPDSIGHLVHLRYLKLSYTNVTSIPASIGRLACLQFLMISNCKNLTQLPSGIIHLGNLRCLELENTPLSFIPKGIGKLKQLNELSGFVGGNNDSSSQLEELNSLNQIRKLKICRLEVAKSGAKNILRALSHLSHLRLDFTDNISERSAEELLTTEKLFDELTPRQSLEELTIINFFGSRFPYWMAISTFERCVPHLTKLFLLNITNCTQLPPLGQMPELKYLEICGSNKLKKIGPEFLGGGAISTVNSSTRIAFPKLQQLRIMCMYDLEEWTFGAEVEENASPRLKLLPCLYKLHIYDCPLLKQLPKGLKHSTMKSLEIIEANSLESLDDLPVQIEELRLS